MSNFSFTPTLALLTGRTVIVTGANTGLGLETAIHIAKLEPELLILAVRTVNKGEEAKTTIATKSGLSASKIAVWELDMASFESTKAFAARAHSQLARLDVLVENAGVFPTKRSSTIDGWEQGVQVNGLATGLLGVSLLPLLAKTAALPLTSEMKAFRPHLTIVGSGGHKWFKPEDVPSSDGGSLIRQLSDGPAGAEFDSMKQYATSKIIALVCARELAELDSTQGGVVVNCVCPGMVASDFQRDCTDEQKAHVREKGISAEEGSKNIALAATDDNLHDQYIALMKPEPTSEFSNSEAGLAFQRQVWKEMSSLWLGVDPSLAL